MKEEIFIVDVLINADFKKVWALLSDPRNFPKIYPNWLKEIKEVKEILG